MSTQTWIDALADVPLTETPPGRVAVLSAHPDDDVIALGRWLAGLPADTLFVVATDGESSHRASGAYDPDDLRRLRAEEHVAARTVLGLHSPVHRLGLPDSALADHEDELAFLLGDLLHGVDLVVAPYRADGHPDHEAVGRAAERVHSGPRWEYPVWTWVWSAPDAALLSRLRRVAPAVGAETKHRAVNCYRTQVQPIGQVEPIVTPDLVAHALAGPEVVVT